MATKYKRNKGKISGSRQLPVRNLKTSGKKEARLVHARIANPILIRKIFLECAIFATEVLRSYDRLKRIRFQKVKCKAQIKRNIGEVKLLNEKLEQVELPRPPQIPRLHSAPSFKEEIHEEVNKQKKQIRMIEGTDSSLDAELKRMKEKLSQL